MTQRPAGGEDDTEQPLIAHLVELRQRLLRSLLCVLLVFLVLAAFANDLYHLVARPLLAQLPPGSGMIATGVAAPFLVPFKLAIYVALLISVPYLLYQLWAFVAPGLYRDERRFVFPLLASSSLLFYAGVAFAYFAAFPLLFGFFTAAAPEGVTVMTDIGEYLGFALKMFLAFGVAFEVPIATVLLIRTGLVPAATLRRLRPYIIVGAFIVGALLTPPDVLSQCLLSIPIWLLFELGLVLGRFVEPATGR
jgi:sec-independent protein translocase protein TatC